jgi:hypothetical protein
LIHGGPSLGPDYAIGDHPAGTLEIAHRGLRYATELAIGSNADFFLHLFDQLAF